MGARSSTSVFSPSKSSSFPLAVERVVLRMKKKARRKVNSARGLRRDELASILPQSSRSKHRNPIHPTTPGEEDKTLEMATPVNPPLLRRSTVSSDASVSSFSFSPRQRASMKNAQCTHLTMTRLYTTEFRCGVCQHPASTGWLYRCTQDREALIEEDLKNGRQFKMDAITDLFPLPSSPRKRSAAARSSKLAFLDEIDDDALKTYTPAQLSTILNQRSQVLDVARATSEDEIFFTSPTPPSQRPSSPSSPTKLFNKPWVDSKGTECQFKCCHACRPTLSERAFLSLDGIANDDTPLTAAVGFGFHLHAQKRPVALVKHVKNLGLRPPPAPRSESSIIHQPQDRASYLASVTQGLGILSSIPKRPLPAIPIPLHVAGLLTPSTNPNPPNQPQALQAQAHLPTSAANPHITPSTHPLIPTIPTITLTPPSPSISITTTTAFQRRPRKGSANVRFETATLTSLPLQTRAEELELLGDDVMMPVPTMMTEMVRACGEMKEMTEMERRELEGGFGNLPLVVEGGVAVTEEAVGLHVADLITRV